MTLVHCLDHVIVLVRDLGAATHTYGDLLGRDPSWNGVHPLLGTANVLFQLDNTYLELLSPAGSSGIGGLLAQRLERDGEGPLGFAFGTRDADSCARELRRRGLVANDPAPGEGKDPHTARVRRWRNVTLPPSTTRGVLVFAIEHAESDEVLDPGALRVDAEATIDGLDHLVLFSSDLEASRTLYGEGFGIRLALDRSFDERRQRILFFRVGGATVEVAGSMDTPPDPEGADRFWGLAWRVPDVDAIRERLHAAGCDVSTVRNGRKPGTRVCTVRGNTHGVPTLLIEPAP